MSVALVTFTVIDEYSIGILTRAVIKQKRNEKEKNVMSVKQMETNGAVIPFLCVGK